MRTVSRAAIPALHAASPGNHDVLGLNQRSQIEPGDPEYEKKLYEDNFGKLQSCKIFRARFDGAQLAWLEADSATAGPSTPTVVITHVPIASGLQSFSSDPGPGPIAANSYAVHSILIKFNVKLVLQGHLHAREKMQYHGIEDLTGGAVSGA